MLIERPVFIAGGAVLIGMGVPLVKRTTELLLSNSLKGWLLALVGWLLVLDGAILAVLPVLWTLRDIRERRAYKARQAKKDSV